MVSCCVWYVETLSSLFAFGRMCGMTALVRQRTPSTVSAARGLSHPDPLPPSPSGSLLGRTAVGVEPPFLSARGHELLDARVLLREEDSKCKTGRE